MYLDSSADQEGPVFIRPRDLSRRLGIGLSAIDRAVRAGDLPKPFRIGKKAKAWKLSEINDYLAQRDRERDAYVDPAFPTAQRPHIEGERKYADGEAVLPTQG
jgi:predicted DNA-binding transcriptional regulator AlpA